MSQKAFSVASSSKSNSIEEEDEIAISKMYEEDLSFQLLEEADTVHK